MKTYEIDGKSKSMFQGELKQEVVILRIFFYVTILLLTGAISFLILDAFNFFENNYFPHTLSFAGIFILIIYFLKYKKKRAAVNSLLFLPVPAYFMMVSARWAIFPPEQAFYHEISLYITGLLILLILANHLIQIVLYLIVTSLTLGYHILTTAGKNNLWFFEFPNGQDVNPLIIYLSIGLASLLIHWLNTEKLKHAEQRVNSLKERQNSIFNQYYEGIIRFRIERDEYGEKIGMTAEEANPAFEEFFEVRNSEIKGKPAHLLFQKIFRDEVDWQGLFEGKRNKKDIFISKTNNWYRVISIKTSKNHFTTVFDNITSARNTLNDLRNSKLRYKLLLETIPDIFFVIDKDGTYTDYVPKTDSGLEMIAGEIIGNTIYEVGFSKKMVRQVSQSIRTVIANDTIETIEYALEVIGKGTCYFEMRMVRLNQQSVMAISRDISRQKFAVQATEEARKKAEEADMLKSAFLQNISHEVRTPLNAIVGFSNVLLADEVSRIERLNYLQIVVRNSQILLHIFNDTIKLSKIQSGMESVNKQYYNINGLIADLNRAFTYEKSQLEKDYLRLVTVSGSDNPKFSIFCDGQKIRDIMESLLDNAIKFTVEGEIRFGYNLIGNTVIEFFVRDTGIGIPEEQFENIFNRFYQIDLSKTRAYGGTGIGLSLARDFSKMLGTKIKVESTLGLGSCFSFTLPVDTANHHLRII